MTARVLCPDDHPDRWHPDPSKRGEAFAHVARTLRDVVLPDPKVRHVVVLVGPPGSGKTTVAAGLARTLGESDAVIVDACHSHRGARAALATKIGMAGKRAIAVVLHTPTEVCVARDKQRSVPRRCGRKIIESQARELRLEPPVRSEGWSTVVTLDPTAPSGSTKGTGTGEQDLSMLVAVGEALRGCP